MAPSQRPTRTGDGRRTRRRLDSPTRKVLLWGPPPFTGGTGTTVVYLLGLVMLIAAAAVGNVSRRRHITGS